MGISIAANKINGIRAALLYDDFSAEYARRHNNANVLVFGGRTMDFELVKERIDVFFSHQFEEGKYKKRNKLLNKTGSSLKELERVMAEEGIDLNEK